MFDDHLRAAPADFASHIGERFDIWRIIIGTALVSVLYVALISGLSLWDLDFFRTLQTILFSLIRGWVTALWLWPVCL